MEHQADAFCEVREGPQSLFQLFPTHSSVESVETLMGAVVSSQTGGDGSAHRQREPGGGGLLATAVGRVIRRPGPNAVMSSAPGALNSEAPRDTRTNNGVNQPSTSSPRRGSGHRVVSVAQLPQELLAPVIAPVQDNTTDIDLVKDIILQATGRNELADSQEVMHVMTDILKEARGDPIQVLKLTLEIMAGNVSGTSMTDNGQNNVDLSSAWELQSISTPQVSGTTVSASLISANGNTYSTREADEYQQVYQDVLQRVGGDASRAETVMRDLGMTGPQGTDMGTRSDIPTRYWHPQQSPPVRSHSEHQNAEVFIDILTRTKGDPLEAIRIMHELGIEVDHASMMSLVASHQTGQSGSRGHACGSPASPTILAGATATSATASPAGETAAPAFGGHHGDATGGSGVPQREHQEGAGPGTRPQADAGATDHPPAGPLSVPVPQMVAKRSLELHSLRNPLCARGEVVLLRTYQALEIATDGFSQRNLLGAGGFGAVYRGRLPDGTDIAVKRLDTTGLQGEKEFQQEIKILGRYQAANIVKLLGYASDKAAHCLVYELMDGSLDSRLEQGAETLTWKHRIAIAMQSAAGLAYLHQGTKFPLAHMDVKSANVLLRGSRGLGDESDFPEAKIGDVGLAQLHQDHMTGQGTAGMRQQHQLQMQMSMDLSMSTDSKSTLRGSSGYLDPVYIETVAVAPTLWVHKLLLPDVRVPRSRLREVACIWQGRGGSYNDVYGFGVVLLELITGRPAIYRSGAGGPSVMLANEVGARLVQMTGMKPIEPGQALQMLQDVERIADPKAGVWPDWALDGLVCCAVSCLLPDRSMRLRMSTLTQRLAQLHETAGMRVPDGVRAVCDNGSDLLGRR